MNNIWRTKINTSGTKVFVGLSGGVDSAVSAALLQREGYEVTGVFIKITVDGYPCTAAEDKVSAQRVAAHLKIPFFEIDLSRAYKQKVFDISIQEFKKGRTPNPDALCNREIKFGLFFDWCIKNGADFVATGHYAQIHRGRTSVELLAGADDQKDQSYFLALVPEEKLQKTFFPIGHLQKPEVRKLATKFGLPNAARKDSQGLCFLGPISIDEMLHKELKLTSGDVLDEDGGVIGKHEGAAAYTLGQRQGFEIFVHTPNSAPKYVINKNITNNTITVSPKKLSDEPKTEIKIVENNWIGKIVDGQYMARYRYRQKLISANKMGDTVTLDEGHHAPAGQILVLYKGDRCLGGGIIE